jgi:hypothetical protein
MGSSSLAGLASWVKNTKWSLTVSPVYVNNKGSVINASFEYMSVCFVKTLEWAAGVAVCDLSNSFGAGGSVTV